MVALYTVLYSKTSFVRFSSVLSCQHLFITFYLPRVSLPINIPGQPQATINCQPHLRYSMISLSSLWSQGYTRLVSLLVPSSRILCQLLTFHIMSFLPFCGLPCLLTASFVMSDDLHCQLLCYTLGNTRPVLPANLLLWRYPWCLQLLENYRQFYMVTLFSASLLSSCRYRLPRSSILVSQLCRTANPPPI